MSDEIVVSKLTSATKEVIEYVDHLKLNKGTLYYLFDSFKSMETIKSGTIILVTENTKSITGLLLAKKSSDEKKEYLVIKVLEADKPELASALLDKLIEIKDEKKYVAITTEAFPLNVKYFSKFKILSNVYGTEISKVKLPAAKIKGVKFSKNNRFHTKNLAELLTEHDITIAKALNKTMGKNLHKINLTSKDHQRVISFFIRSIARDPNWFVYLLFSEGSNHPIGFIKVKLDPKQEMCFPNLYITDKYYDKYYSSAYKILVDGIKDRKVKYFGRIETESDKSANRSSKTILSNILGHQYFLL